MKILIIHNTEPKDQQFNDPLVKMIANLVEFDAVSYKEIPEIGTLLDKYIGVILSGVPTDYSFDTIDNRLPFIKQIFDNDIPFLGICLGHHNIGRLFGSSIIRDQEAEDGEFPISIVQDDPIFNNIPSVFMARLLHTGSITLPTNFELIAKSQRCANQAMKHKSKCIYGFQFHPELSVDGEIIFRNFISITKRKRLK